MAKSRKIFPETLLVYSAFSDDEILLAAETPEDIQEMHADRPVAVYKLHTVGKLVVDKHVEAKPGKRKRTR